jgi:hypothetical protein
MPNKKNGPGTIPETVEDLLRSSTKSHTLHFEKEKETKNTVKFEEKPEPGKPPLVGSLYLQKWAAGGATRVDMSITLS